MQLLGLAGVVAGLIIAFNLNRQLSESQRLREAADRAATEAAVLRAENAALQTQVAYATTDAAVIAWAHEQGKLVQPGEVLVVAVVPTPAPTPAPPPPVLPLPPPTWALWWNLFFDGPVRTEP
jgi:NAD(P)-dependent dehydrogenase (short-subunit alcohol dehydrogenase family)